MNRLSTLLAATDLSAPARHALERAAHLARACGARLEVLHVLEGDALDTLRHLLGAQARPVETRLLDEAHKALRDLAVEVCAPLEVEAGLTVETGPVLKAILSKADAVDADLIVTGARGAGLMRHLVLGTTAERLLRKTLRPMLVVRRPAAGPYRRVLVAVDFSPWTSRSIAAARAVAPGAELTLLHPFEVPFEGKLRFAGVGEGEILQYRAAAQREAQEGLRQAAREAGLDGGGARLAAVFGEPSLTLLEQAETGNAELIVLGKHGRGVTEELLLGSVTKHVLAEAPCDVLVVQEPSPL